MTNEQRRKIAILVSAVIAVFLAVRAYLFDNIANTGIAPIDNSLESTHDFAAVFSNTLQGIAFFGLAMVLIVYLLPVSKETTAPNV